VRALTIWSPLEIGMTTMERAWHVDQRYQLSWWDALIVARAQASGCRYLLTEDLQHG
jgi:predicted nucleic acid-binding protein